MSASDNAHCEAIETSTRRIRFGWNNIGNDLLAHIVGGQSVGSDVLVNQRLSASGVVYAKGVSRLMGIVAQVNQQGGPASEDAQNGCQAGGKTGRRGFRCSTQNTQVHVALDSNDIALDR